MKLFASGAVAVEQERLLTKHPPMECKPMNGQKGLTTRMRLRRLWRRLTANKLIADLRCIQVDKRFLYRARIETGAVGWCLNALIDAERNGHLANPRANAAQLFPKRKQFEGLPTW